MAPLLDMPELSSAISKANWISSNGGTANTSLRQFGHGATMPLPKTEDAHYTVTVHTL